MTRVLFRFDHEGSVAGWVAIDDAVMGGVSASRLAWADAGHALFTGVVSLAHGGGFASVRSPVADHALPGATCYLLEARGDGRRYKLNLRTDDGFDGINYQAAFTPAADGWSLLRLPIADFRPRFRGRTLDAAPPLDPARVRQVGLMIADRQPGPFTLALRSIVAASETLAETPGPPR
ncbi:MAG: CIA30 family protein [Betaproteobacteria bacterium]|nr:CIA30 family protein [Betaproteobacteria bacterium]MBK9674380.1 CIA30 family protein [Betaproteobacteria bacterium]